MMSKPFRLMYSIGISLAAGIIGSLFTFSAIPTWYAALRKPFFTPPNWLFGPVWTVLYILMGISLYLVLGLKDSKTKKNAVQLFYAQLVLNALWSVIFFGLKIPVLGAFEIAVLWIVILLTILKFNKLSRVASGLLVPYLLWVTYASALNIAVAVLNP